MLFFNRKKDVETAEADSDTNAAVRKSLVRRLDSVLMVYVCCSYCMKYIDQTAHSNAYVTGMKEDLHMFGKEYNWVNSFFSIGYCIGSIVSQTMTARWRPSIVVPTYELLWSVFIMVNAAAKNVHLLYVRLQVYATLEPFMDIQADVLLFSKGMRFLIGFLESVAYPGFVTVLASWYTPGELAKRVAFLQASSAAGSMFSGYLQAAIYAGLNGRLGLAGWRWLFIMDGVISIPIATAGYFMIPDTPAISRASWLKPEHLIEGQRRMDEVGRAPRGKLTIRKVLAVFKEWPAWLVLVAYPAETTAASTIQYFNLFLKSNPDGRHFSVYQVNLIPSGGQALQLVSTIAFATLSDRLRKRLPVMTITLGLGLLGEIMLSIWNIGFAGKFTAYMFIYMSVGSGALLLTWYSEEFGADAEVRTLILGMVNGVGYAWQAAWPFLMFPANEAPAYRYGYKIAIAFYSTTLLLSYLMAYLIKRFGAPYTNVPKSEEQLNATHSDEYVEEDQEKETGDDGPSIGTKGTTTAVVTVDTHGR